MSRPYCWTCKRAREVCLCADIRPFETASRVVILAHPREARRKTSTGWLLHKTLPGSRYLLGFDFRECVELNALLSDTGYVTYLLFPGPGARDARELRTHEPFPIQRQYVVLEGTWAQAKTMLARSPALWHLPRVQLEPKRPSDFRIRTQPGPACLSTIEALGLLLEETGEASRCECEAMLAPFRRLVERQIAYQIDRHPDHVRKWESCNQKD